MVKENKKVIVICSTYLNISNIPFLSSLNEITNVTILDASDLVFCRSKKLPCGVFGADGFNVFKPRSWLAFFKFLAKHPDSSIFRAYLNVLPDSIIHLSVINRVVLEYRGSISATANDPTFTNKIYKRSLTDLWRLFLNRVEHSLICGLIFLTKKRVIFSVPAVRKPGFFDRRAEVIQIAHPAFDKLNSKLLFNETTVRVGKISVILGNDIFETYDYNEDSDELRESLVKHRQKIIKRLQELEVFFEIIVYLHPKTKFENVESYLKKKVSKVPLSCEVLTDNLCVLGHHSTALTLPYILGVPIKILTSSELEVNPRWTSHKKNWLAWLNDKAISIDKPLDQNLFKECYVDIEHRKRMASELLGYSEANININERLRNYFSQRP